MQINDIIHGFKILNIRHLDEVKGDMYEMVHEKTGARTIWLKRDDENKTFSIAFKTTPVDDTGVFHILEHSVLNGSRKYPVREPFVDLLKGSLQTFLNAMTYPDKTVYPVSSRNDKDFVNLMRVYLDAVFYPLVLNNPNVFYQEGWHYELNDVNEDPIYKGVVFNEMKGAFSSPDGVKSRLMMHALFPDNCYGNESGGDPDFITDLSYEQFCAAHRKYYNPSNSYIFLDGAMDIDQILAIINDEYLSNFGKEGDLIE
ncbi:MAG: insulinase family protein, partial [Erysipelotrichaceae bacterium]|nr:insulinase family protein [Erysipelotrichaceae bacterium]